MKILVANVVYIEMIIHFFLARKFNIDTEKNDVTLEQFSIVPASKNWACFGYPTAVGYHLSVSQGTSLHYSAEWRQLRRSGREKGQAVWWDGIFVASHGKTPYHRGWEKSTFGKHPQRLTANEPKNRQGHERKLIFQASFLRGYVKFRGHPQRLTAWT